jgi:hypothetical protein
MRPSSAAHETTLNLLPEDLVEVRSEAEILATLDAQSRLDELPFMPEMLEYCGKQFRVYKRSDKTCDTINNSGSRRMKNTVHLDDLRCDGSAHDGCQARCLIFWKEAWLKRVRPSFTQKISASILSLFRQASSSVPSENLSLSREAVLRSTFSLGPQADASERVYSCQATELLKASAPLPWWDFRQYVTDIWTGNARVSHLVGGAFILAFNQILKLGGYRMLTWGYNKCQQLHGGIPYPYRDGKLAKTPTEDLNLQPGDLVQVKSHEEIVNTLDVRNRNRGLKFDVEMVPFCSGQHRVLQRVERIINEKTGKMSHLPGTCIMLEGVTCRSLYSESRIGCPRSIYSYWREIWLRRAE